MRSAASVSETPLPKTLLPHGTYHWIRLEEVKYNMRHMSRKLLCPLGIVVIFGALAAVPFAQQAIPQRWLGGGALGKEVAAMQTDGVVTEFPLPNPGSGP